MALNQNRTFAKKQISDIIVDKKESGYIFAALKLIEKLYHDKLISRRVFNSILNDCAGVVDLSQFVIEEDKEKKDMNDV